jgi:hypothetical protein
LRGGEERRDKKEKELRGRAKKEKKVSYRDQGEK